MTNSSLFIFDAQDIYQPSQIQIRIQIPQKYHQEPIISQLVALFNLKISILAAVLGRNGIGGGWFELDIQGKPQQIENAIVYLKEQGIVIWDELMQQQDTW